MKYKNIIKAVFISRPNRFIAKVLIDGHEETVHVKNTGRCKELLIPGCEAWLTEPGTPERKTKYDLVAVRKSTGYCLTSTVRLRTRSLKNGWKQKGTTA